MILAIIMLFFNIHLFKLKVGDSAKRIESLMQGTVLWMLFAFAATEILSLFHMINFASLFVSWMIFDIVLTILFIIQSRKRSGWKQCIYDCFPKELILRRNLPKSILCVIAFIVFGLAFFTVPYNWDSMTYRLSRVAYWLQNGSVEHYATNSLRAISNPPLGEFIQLHLYTLTGGDGFLNLIQYASYIFCSILIYVLAKRLLCRQVFSFLATVLFMTTPIAFAEAINTQVDLFASVWLLIFVYFLMDFIEMTEQIKFSGENVFKAAIMGLCVAWGYLSKPNVCVAMLVFGLWLLIKCIGRKEKVLVLFCLAGSAFFAMIIPLLCEMGRNMITFHAISAPISGARQLIGTFEPKYVFVNFLKNVTFNFPIASVSQLTNIIEKAVKTIAALLRVDINATSIAEDGLTYALTAPEALFSHDTAINPIIAWLTATCLIWSLLKLLSGILNAEYNSVINNRWGIKLFQSYSIAVLSSFLLFCAVLRWEPFITRYMIPFLALLCPAIAACLQNMAVEMKQGYIYKYLIIGAVTCLCLLDLSNMTLYHMKWCISHSNIFEKSQGYFGGNLEKYTTYARLCQIIKDGGYRYIGISSGENDYQYPIWALLKNDIVQMEHVNVGNESVIYTNKEYVPQCIIWLGKLPQVPYVWNGQAYFVAEEVGVNSYLLKAKDTD